MMYYSAIKVKYFSSTSLTPYQETSLLKDGRTLLTPEISITLTFRVQRKCCQGRVCETDF